MTRRDRKRKAAGTEKDDCLNFQHQKRHCGLLMLLLCCVGQNEAVQWDLGNTCNFDQ